MSYHTPRFVLVPGLGEMAEVVTPADRGAGHVWTPVRASVPVRIGYVCAPDPDTDIGDQLSALEAVALCARTFVDVVGPTVKARPELNRAIELAAEQRRCAENQPVLFTAYDLGALARTAAELIEVAGSLRAADVHLELLTGQMAGVYDPNGTGSMFFTVLDAAGALDRQHHRRRIEAGQRAAGDRGRRGGRPKVFDDAMLCQARSLRDEGVPVPEIARRLTITTGKNAGRHPSLASVYRALSEEVSPRDEELSDAGPYGERTETAPGSAQPLEGLS